MRYAAKLVPEDETMDTPIALVVSIYLIAGLSNGAMGYAIWVRRKYGWISGFDVNRVADPEPLGRCIGQTMLIIGGVLCAAAVNTVVLPQHVASIALIVGVVALVVAGMGTLRASRFYRARL